MREGDQEAVGPEELDEPDDAHEGAERRESGLLVGGVVAGVDLDHAHYLAQAQEVEVEGGESQEGE